MCCIKSYQSEPPLVTLEESEWQRTWQDLCEQPGPAEHHKGFLSCWLSPEGPQQGGPTGGGAQGRKGKPSLLPLQPNKHIHLFTFINFKNLSNGIPSAGNWFVHIFCNLFLQPVNLMDWQLTIFFLMKIFVIAAKSIVFYWIFPSLCWNPPIHFHNWLKKNQTDKEEGGNIDTFLNLFLSFGLCCSYVWISSALFIKRIWYYLLVRYSIDLVIKLEERVCFSNVWLPHPQTYPFKFIKHTKFIATIISILFKHHAVLPTRTSTAARESSSQSVSSILSSWTSLGLGLMG